MNDSRDPSQTKEIIYFITCMDCEVLTIFSLAPISLALSKLMKILVKQFRMN